jgi:hypothetical protein
VYYRSILENPLSLKVLGEHLSSRERLEVFPVVGKCTPRFDGMGAVKGYKNACPHWAGDAAKKKH